MSVQRSSLIVTHFFRVERSRQRGLSLIELMVALALGLIIVAALSQLFVNISRTNLEMAKTNSQIENARYAMQFMHDDIVHAGYWGGYIPDFDDLTVEGDPDHEPTAKPAPVCLAYTSAWTIAYIDSLLGIPAEVYGPGALPTGCGAVVTDRLADTDLLILRHAATCVAGDPNCEAEVSGKLYLQVSNCGSDTDLYSLDPNAPALLEIDCLPANPVAKRKFVQNIYYIRDYANVAGDDIPTLVRSEFDLTPGGDLEQQAPVALVEGIERFRVELGIDRKSQTNQDVDYTAAIDWLDEDVRTTPTNRGDGVPEGGFERCLSEDAGCEALDDLANVVAVKIYVLAKTSEATPGYTDTKIYELGSSGNIGPFSDGFKRHVFHSTVRLNNPAGRRETPFDPNEVVTP
jgi:type IV pilus assembly protein PilW